MIASALSGAVLAVAAGSGSSAAASGAQAGTGPAPYRESIAGTLVTFDMVPVDAGTVGIGGATENVAPFHIARTEATWDMYDVFALGLDGPKATGSADAIARPSQPYGAPDYGWGHAGYPVISVTRAAAEAFCDWLSRKTGRRYRLPSEAEWQLAATRAAAGDTLDALAWHRGNASGRTHPVGSRKSDALGLFDLFGNAGEWVTTADGALVLRGGSFRDPPERVGPAARVVQEESWNERDPQLPKSRWWLSDAPFAGFRVVSPSASNRSQGASREARRLSTGGKKGKEDEGEDRSLGILLRPL